MDICYITGQRIGDVLKIRYSDIEDDGISLWLRATTSAGIEDAHIHDIRAKAATDAKAQGLDSKSLLGHASESAHLRYLRGKETPVAEPVRIRKS